MEIEAYVRSKSSARRTLTVMMRLSNLVRKLIILAVKLESKKSKSSYLDT